MRDIENSAPKGQVPETNVSRGRPRGFNEDDVLRRLVNVFWDKGYEATSLNDIVAATELKKGSLYSLFGSKRDMYLKALAHYNGEYVKTACADLIDKKAGSARTRLDRFLSSPIEAMINDGDNRGCFLCNATAETTTRDKDIKALIAAGHNDMVGALETALQEDNPTDNNEPVAQRARALLVTYTGLRILVRASPDVDLLQAAKKAALEF